MYPKYNIIRLAAAARSMVLNASCTLLKYRNLYFNVRRGPIKKYEKAINIDNNKNKKCFDFPLSQRVDAASLELNSS